jgi:ABC-type multidrug transport system fused ATPase/permease subunit
LVAGACLVAVGIKSNPALAGVAITYSIVLFYFIYYIILILYFLKYKTMSSLFQWVVRNFIESENYMVSVERILHYSKKVPLEPPSILENKRTPKDWPNKGEITFRNVFVKYRPNLQPVLKDINFEIKPSEKIAIVGRTGFIFYFTFIYFYLFLFSFLQLLNLFIFFYFYHLLYFFISTIIFIFIIYYLLFFYFLLFYIKY